MIQDRVFLKQAVVLIHGIGEQIPMDTLRGFVETVWEKDAGTRFRNVPGTAWSHPDEMSRNFELRRLTTAFNREDVRTDFFELYWADLMKDTKLSQVGAWAWMLLFRRPEKVPPQLRPLWWGLWLLGLVLAAWWITHLTGGAPAVQTGTAKLLAALGHVVWLGLACLLVNYAGDAARYLHVAPPNIGSRRVIREAGVTLLQTLHEAREAGGKRKYERIILVGHSLGTVIGYDILTHLWPRYHTSRAHGVTSVTAALEALEGLAREAADNEAGKRAQAPDFAARYQAAQAAYFQELAGMGCEWRVTDFLTMGSPLAHGDFLLSRNAAEFARQKATREFPTCPPTLEEVTLEDKATKERKFSFIPGTWLPHHAAVFGPTRWTNLYFPCKAVVVGDLVGGPVAPVFGPGVVDVPVKTSIWRGLLSHTFYWDFPSGRQSGDAPDWIESLRKAVRISEPVTPHPLPPEPPAAATAPLTQAVVAGPATGAKA